MRNYLSGALRCRFDLAWRVVPEPIQAELKNMVVSVRQSNCLETAAIKRANGSIIKSIQDAGAWFLPDPTGGRKRGFITIRSDFGNGERDGDEVGAVVTILHELAHGVQYIEGDWDLFTETQSEKVWEEHRWDVAAWLQVATWLARDRSHYRLSNLAMRFALKLANEELLAYGEHTFRETAAELFRLDERTSPIL